MIIIINNKSTDKNSLHVYEMQVNLTQTNLKGNLKNISLIHNLSQLRLITRKKKTFFGHLYL